MSHKKCPISEVLLESIHGISLSFFVLYINLIYVLNFESECPKRHILISPYIHISLWWTYFLQIPTSLCIIFIVVSPAMLFGTSNNLMCHIFLILSYVYIFLSDLILFFSSNNLMCHIFLILSYVCIFLSDLILFFLVSVQSLSHRQCLLPHPTHHHKCHLSLADTPTTQQNNTFHGQSTSPPCCPPAASHFPH